MKLIKYDAACRAIAAAKQVDEVKKIRDVSVAMRAYARQAGNRSLEADAVEIRMRATRRMDQMRQEQAATVGLAKGGGGKHGRKRVAEKPTLKDAGVGKHLAHEGRKLGALTNREFERAVETARESVSRVVKEALHSDNKKERRATREKMAKIDAHAEAAAPWKWRRTPFPSRCAPVAGTDALSGTRGCRRGRAASASWEAR
jgi:hypothetical protein